MPRAAGNDREAGLRQFVELLPDFLRASLGVLEEKWLKTTPTQRPGAQRNTRDSSTLVDFARDELLKKFQQRFSAGLVPLRGGDAVAFAFVSEDRLVVGQFKEIRGRLPLASITDLIWQLQRAEGAERRLLVVGPDARPVDRWLAKYGHDAAHPVEVWTVGQAHLSRVA